MSEPTPNAGDTGAPASPPAAAPSAAPPPAAPPKPAAPAKPAATAKGGKDRRFFLLAVVGSWFAIAWTALAASSIGMLLGTVRFMFPNVLVEAPSKFKAGFPDQYEDGKVVERFKDQNSWIVRNEGIMYALSTTCTHLGCTPNWLEREQKFKCPCHGSGFKISGVNFEGPAPRPLERWAISIGDDGQIVVDKSRKFQKELGQWDNPESFIKV
jgi:cytochrome b6-f complex iron-sulfur subunit